MEPIIDHIDITVNDLVSAGKFYDNLLPLLGFELKDKRESYEAEDDYRQIEYVHKNLIFSVVQAAERAKNIPADYQSPGSLHHLAFRAESNKSVDDFYSELNGTGAKEIIPPKFYKQYSPDYYAVFFRDPFGIRYEFVHYDIKNR
ncbi:MAG: VOC family protein [Clostridiaceae bacterium]|jgi:catechol 2,3-dioxygenase-like lactoylglutathione lyase family enzyme|nr:VOC family protein [Clostridiaceae bacterium]